MRECSRLNCLFSQDLRVILARHSPLAPLPRRESVDTSPRTRSVTTVVFSPDGATLASAGFGARVTLWDVVAGKEKAALVGRTWGIWSVAFSPDGKTLAAGTKDGAVNLWDIATGRERLVIRQHTSADGVRFVAFSSDGRTLATADYGSQVRLWEVETGKGRRRLDVNGVGPVMFAADGKTLVTSSKGGTVRLWAWDGNRGEVRSTFESLQGWSRPVAISPDGKKLATGVGDAMKLWDVATAKEEATFQGHRGTVSSVAFSPDGKTLASASEDRTVRLWDVATGKARIRGVHLNPVGAIAFSSDGKFLASGSRRWHYQALGHWSGPTASDPPSCGRCSICRARSGRQNTDRGWRQHNQNLGRGYRAGAGHSVGAGKRSGTGVFTRREDFRCDGSGGDREDSGIGYGAGESHLPGAEGHLFSVFP